MKSQPQRIRNVVGTLIGKLEEGPARKASLVRDAWEKALWEEALKKTRPVSLKKGMLTVLVENSSWLYRLTLEKRNILRAVNDNYVSRNRIKDIKFRIGELDT